MYEHSDIATIFVVPPSSAIFTPPPPLVYSVRMDLFYI